MKKNILSCLLLLGILSISGCSGETTKDDLLGKWSTGDETTTLELTLKNNSCEYKQIKRGKSKVKDCTWSYENMRVQINGNDIGLKVVNKKLLLGNEEHENGENIFTKEK